MAKDESPQAPPAADQRPHHQISTRIGPSQEFKGDLNGHEHTLIEGRFTGSVTIPSGSLTIARGARVEAEIKVRELVLHGELKGNVVAGERIQISETGKMDGDIAAAKVSISNGARFKGSIRVK